MTDTQSTIARRANNVRQHGGIILTKGGLDIEIRHTPHCELGQCFVDCPRSTAQVFGLDTGLWKSIEEAVAHVMGVRWEGTGAA